jgi:hypothetical protein
MKAIRLLSDGFFIFNRQYELKLCLNYCLRSFFSRKGRKGPAKSAKKKYFIV